MNLKDLINEFLAFIFVIFVLPIVLFLAFVNWITPSDEELARESYDEC